MRLSAEQRKVIRDIISRSIKDDLVNIFLYGSRTNDQLKGGDIDLILVIKSAEARESLNEYSLLNELKKQPCIGDQKIDLKVVLQSEISNDLFLKTISQTLIEI